MSGGLLEGRSRHRGDLKTAKNQRIKNAWLQFDLTPEIKPSGASEGNKQAIKDTFCLSKNFITVANALTRNELADWD